MVQGNLGVSLRSGRAVLDEIAAVLPGTLELGLLGALIGLGIGLPVGILSAVYQDRPADRGMRFAVYVCISLPEFWLGTLMVLLFSIHFRWLPAGGYADLFQDPLEGLRFVVMPAVVLGLTMAAFLSRVVRSTMLETLRQDYVTVARAKGLSGPSVLLNHALRNAAGPIITLVGLQIAFLISGSVIVEEVFVRARSRAAAGAVDLPARLRRGAGRDAALHGHLRVREPAGRRAARRGRSARARAGMNARPTPQRQCAHERTIMGRPRLAASFMVARISDVRTGNPVLVSGRDVK